MSLGRRPTSRSRSAGRQAAFRPPPTGVLPAMRAGVLALLVLTIGCGPHPTAAGPAPQTAVARDTIDDVIDYPDSPVTIVYIPDPVFPDSLRRQGRCGHADLEYIVGVNGRAEPRSIRVRNATELGFRQPAIRAIEAAKFTPAVYKGRPVRARILQRVKFSIPGFCRG